MKTQSNKLSFPLLLTAAILNTACSSGGGGSSASSSSGATVPANSVEITAANAEATITTAVGSVIVLDAALGVEASPAIGLMAALSLAKPRLENIKAALQNSGVDLVNGVDGDNPSEDCIIDGTFSSTGHTDNSPPNLTENGSFTFTDCDDGRGFVLNGNLSFSDSSNDATGDYNETLSGTLAVKSLVSADATLNPTFSFNEIDFNKTGNNFDFFNQTYTTTKTTFAYDRSTNGVGGNGFLASLTTDIVESNGGANSCPESGSILITGANGTTAEGIYNGDDTMTIKANGVDIGLATFCVYYF